MSGRIPVIGGVARLLVSLPLAIAAVLIVPSAASAATMGDFGRYTAGNGEVNNVVVTGNGPDVTITDTAGLTLTGFSDCTQVNPTTIKCTEPSYLFDLGDMSDSFTYAGGSFPLDPIFQYPIAVYSGPGSDSVNGSPYADELYGDDSDPAGNDTINGGDGDDLITDGDGSSNALTGGAGNDNVRAGTGQNAISGGPGNDVVGGGDGPDTASGGDGDDTVFGGAGEDTVLGDAGTDDVEGNQGLDITDGGPGSDFVEDSGHGGCGGPDTMIGGPGRDNFYVACGIPTLKFQDGEADTGRCLRGVTSGVKEYDKADRAAGGFCQTYVKKCKKKKKKNHAAAAAKKKKKKKCKRVPYQPPQGGGEA
jgi:Ca2+-binding RTX toxin-like protein